MKITLQVANPPEGTTHYVAELATEPFWTTLAFARYKDGSWYIPNTETVAVTLAEQEKVVYLKISFGIPPEANGEATPFITADGPPQFHPRDGAVYLYDFATNTLAQLEAPEAPKKRNILPYVVGGAFGLALLVGLVGRRKK